MPQDQSAPDLDRPLTPRAQEVVAAARAEFAQQGYAGATTDTIARRAGVSQPYVVRLFGSKERLFLRCCRDAQDAVLGAFRAGIARTADPEEHRPAAAVLGDAYQSLITDQPQTLQLIVQINTMGQHPTFGATARAWFLEVYSVIRHEAGFTEEAARMFVARGMLINTLVSLGLEQDDADASELLAYLAPAGQRPPIGT